MFSCIYNEFLPRLGYFWQVLCVCYYAIYSMYISIDNFVERLGHGTKDKSPLSLNLLANMTVVGTELMVLY